MKPCPAWLPLLLVPLAFSTLAAAPASQPSTEFIRFVEERNGDARLESAEATYRNKQGATVHLIAAVHIADAQYFRGLDESFDHYDALLYEMVKPKGMGRPCRANRQATGLASFNAS